jgi:hypothetical protein
LQKIININLNINFILILNKNKINYYKIIIILFINYTVNYILFQINLLKNKKKYLNKEKIYIIH